MTDTPKEFDVRVVPFHLRNRNIKEEDYQAYLDAIPDDAAECVETETRFSNPFERRSQGEDAEQD